MVVVEVVEAAPSEDISKDTPELVAVSEYGDCLGQIVK